MELKVVDENLLTAFKTILRLRLKFNLMHTEKKFVENIFIWKLKF